MMAKKAAKKRNQYAVWLLDAEAPARVARLVELMQAEMPIKVSLSAGQCVAAAIEEAITRREEKDGHAKSKR